jgi:phosphoglycerol transferase
VTPVLIALVVVGGGTAFVSTVRVGQYIKAANSDYDISDYYRNAKVVDSGKVDNKKNLVLIYLESGEQTLSDTKLFEKDPFVPLEKSASLSDGWKSVKNFHPVRHSPQEQRGPRRPGGPERRARCRLLPWRPALPR